jgi:hypothetical protein
MCGDVPWTDTVLYSRPTPAATSPPPTLRIGHFSLLEAFSEVICMSKTHPVHTIDSPFCYYTRKRKSVSRN